MLNAIWGRVAVTEDSLVQCLHEIRNALADADQTIIRTVPRRGYIFTPEPVSQPASVAVLPFRDISGEHGNRDYFGEGLAEELISALARLPGLRVSARSESFRFRGQAQDVRAVGRALGVEALIEGSVRWADGRARITVQLIDAADGSSLWSDRFERPGDDVFALQASIAQAVSERLRPPCASPAGRTAAQRHVPVAEAYHLYLKGRYFWNKRSGSSLRKALCCWQQAAETDPAYALPHVGIADAHTLLAYLGYAAPDEAYREVRAAASKALALDEEAAEAHVSVANFKLHYEWDFAGAEAELRRAISLEERYYHAYHVLSHYYVAVGSLEKSLQASRRALELEPGFAMAHSYPGEIYTKMGRYEDAVTAFDRALELTEGGNSD